MSSDRLVQLALVLKGALAADDGARLDRPVPFLLPHCSFVTSQPVLREGKESLPHGSSRRHLLACVSGEPDLHGTKSRATQE